MRRVKRLALAQYSWSVAEELFLLSPGALHLTKLNRAPYLDVIWGERHGQLAPKF